MKKILKVLAVGLGGVLALGLVAILYVYGASEYQLRKRYDVRVEPFAAADASDSEALARGKHLATIYGCYNSCHGHEMSGAALFDDPGVARINAPNLTHVLREYSDGELERVIRHGVKRDGTTTWVMPAQMFTAMSDRDLKDVIAFVRSVPASDGLGGGTELRIFGRLGVVLGKFTPVAQQVDQRAAHAPVTDTRAFGEYLVKTACTECHGTDLHGSDFLHAPNLVISAAYSDEDFERLLRTGVALGNRKVGMMTEAAEDRFVDFTPEELAAVRGYLREYVAQQTSVSSGAVSGSP